MSWLVSIIESTHFLLALLIGRIIWTSRWHVKVLKSAYCSEVLGESSILRYEKIRPCIWNDEPVSAQTPTSPVCPSVLLMEEICWPVDRGVCPIIYRVLCIYIYIHIAGWCRISAINRTQNMKILLLIHERKHQPMVYSFLNNYTRYWLVSRDSKMDYQ